MSMINPDNLQASQIQRKLQSKDFILIQNEKNNHRLWNHDISLIGQINAEGAQEIFDGWAACNHCFTAYRTHSKTNTEQNRKNYGLRPFHAHLKECKAKQNKVVNNIQSSFSTASSSKASTQPSISQFAYNKNLLNENLAAKLKDAELKFVVTGSHSFNTLENGGLLDLLQVGIEIGAKNGLVNVRDIFYGRKTIRQEAINKFELFVSSIRCLLDEPVKRHCIAATCDLGSNDIVKRSYLDFTVFMSDDNYQLHHCLLRCKHFPNETKTAINIWNEIKQIFQSFGLSFGDTPIVTDQGANMVAAFKLTDEARFPCMAHRCHTTIETAWDRLDTKNTQFSTFNTAVKDIRKYVQRSGGIQENLEKTIKSSSGTRPWRSYFNVYGSLHTSYKQLLTILRHRNQQHRLYQIDPVLLCAIADLMKSFLLIFDSLEFANVPTLQNVVPSYYMLKYYVQPNKNDLFIFAELKVELLNSLEEKYALSITELHWIASYLDPSFKNFSFIDDLEYLDKKKKAVRKGIHILATDLFDQSHSTFSSITQDTSTSADTPSSKRFKQDPFADFRQKTASPSPTVFPTKRAWTVELDRQIQIYEHFQLDSDYNNNPLSFWKNQKDTINMLSNIANSLFVIPASSAESERHFSIAGQIVTEQRSLLDPDTIEALVVLKEAYINNIWPASVTGSKK
ncbi:unnamed protein product [Rotaria sp. Silwood1]|nr:unnamed protein product [Rotaria sp. Silwood1]